MKCDSGVSWPKGNKSPQFNAWLFPLLHAWRGGGWSLFVHTGWGLLSFFGVATRKLQMKLHISPLDLDENFEWSGVRWAAAGCGWERSADPEHRSAVGADLVSDPCKGDQMQVMRRQVANHELTFLGFCLITHTVLCIFCQIVYISQSHSCPDHPSREHVQFPPQFEM